MTSTLDVTQAQVDEMVAATGTSEQEIRQIYDQMKGKFPSDGITEEKFLECFNQAPRGSNDGIVVSPKDLFAITDRNHSGKIGLDELLLTMGLFKKSDRETVMNSLFKLCDTDHDGFVTQAEIADVWAALLKAMAKIENEIDPNEMNGVLEKIKSKVGKVFGDKTKVSPEEFRQFSIENDVIGGLGEFAFIGLQNIIASFV